MSIEAGNTVQKTWGERITPVISLLGACLRTYGELMVTSRLNPDLHGNQDPLDAVVAEFAVRLPDHYKSSDWDF